MAIGYGVGVILEERRLGTSLALARKDLVSEDDYEEEDS